MGRSQVTQALDGPSALLPNVHNIRIRMGGKNNCFCSLRMWKDLDKNQLTSLKLCISSFLCGFRADLWPFNGFYWNRFALTAFSIYEERQREGKYILYIHNRYLNTIVLKLLKPYRLLRKILNGWETKTLKLAKIAFIGQETVKKTTKTQLFMSYVYFNRRFCTF